METKVYVISHVGENQIIVRFDNMYRNVTVLLQPRLQLDERIAEEFKYIVNGSKIIEFANNTDPVLQATVSRFLSICRDANAAYQNEENQQRQDEILHLTNTLLPSLQQMIANIEDSNIRSPAANALNALRCMFDAIRSGVNPPPATQSVIHATQNLMQSVLQNPTQDTVHSDDMREQFVHTVLSNMRGDMTYGDRNTNPPERFSVNENAPRETVETDAPRVTSDSPHIDQTHIVSQPRNVVQRSLPEATIKSVAANVYAMMANTSVRAPDFTRTTRTGYRKIRNFIHNITKIWLANNEIDAFCVELNRMINQE